MSDYRDDSQDTAIIGDETWLGLRNLVIEDSAKIVATVAFGLFVGISDSAAITDETDGWRTGNSPAFDSAQVSDTATGLLDARQVVLESAKAGDALRHRLYVEHADAASISDEVGSGLSSYLSDSAGVSETWLTTLHARVELADKAKASDLVGHFFRSVVEDSALAADQHHGTLRALERVTDSALAGDELGDTGVVTADGVTDAAQITDAATGTLYGVQQVTDSAQITDSFIVDAGSGQIWVANTDTRGWAMSRYLISADGVAVIDGVAYLTTPDGVFALDGTDEEITAYAQTGRVDVTEGTLGTPVSLYLEYELDGSLDVGVTQYQRGLSGERYEYQLPGEPADCLTNGRVMFGKGLRGRHFTFDLTLTGQQAYINDMSVLVAQGKRRI